MPLLTVTKNTLFKKSAAQSSSLPDRDKFSVDKGQSFNVKYAFRVGQHCFVKLQQELGTVGKVGYFFLQDVNVKIEEIRGVWLTNVDSDVLHSSSNIKESLQRLKDLGFNTIYPVVWEGGFTLYPSAIAQGFIGLPVMPDPNFKDRDMLAEVIEEAKPHSFRVIPWFEFGLMAPPNSDLAQKHEGLLTLDSRQQKIRLKSHDDNKPDDYVWLNPCHPEVQKFMVDLIADVAARYEIDGIQLDDHFGFPMELGYDQFTQDLYQTDNAGSVAPQDHTNPDWVEWASRKVTDLLAQVFNAVKTKRSDCLISISPNPQQFSKKHYLADWKSWRRKGIAEELVLQVYRNNLPAFANELDKQEVIDARVHIPFSIGILTGLKMQPIELDLIKILVNKTQEKNFTGVSFFFYETFFNELVLNKDEELQIIARELSKLPDIFA
jgi:uncharacterized lipoprotein YddW (UPF0748 family)